MNRTGYVDQGGEVTAERDQTGHEHVYNGPRWGEDQAWCFECRCWVGGRCDHENRPMCQRRSQAVIRYGTRGAGEQR